MQQGAAEIDERMDRASSGDDEAFAALALALQDELFRFCLAQGLSSADAGETVQETLLRAYRGRKRWRKGRHARPWMLGIAMNVLREYWRKQRRPVEGVDLSAVPCGNSAEDPAETDERAAMHRLLSLALAALPSRQREAVACRFLRRMSVQETAVLMGCAEGTVKATVHSALRNLREKLRHALPATEMQHE